MIRIVSAGGLPQLFLEADVGRIQVNLAVACIQHGGSEVARAEHSKRDR